MNNGQALSSASSIQRSFNDSALHKASLDDVLDSTNIQRAWRQVRRNKGSAGIDHITINEFTDWILPQWRGILLKLKSNSISTNAS